MSDESSVAPRRRPGRRRATLRGRLVAVLLLVLTVGFAAAALVTVVVVRQVLVDRLDAQLRAAGDRFAVGLEHNDQDADNSPGGYGSVRGQLAGTLGARVAGGRVTQAAVIGDHDNTDSVPPAARTLLARLAADRTPRSVALPGLGTYRVIVADGRDNDRQITGLPVEPVEETIDRLVLIEIAVFGVTLFVLAVASTGLVRLMLRPLTRMADTAAEVSALPLDSGGVSLPHRVATDPHGREVDTLAHAFNAMLAQVESALLTRDESEKQLRRFIADASHELRTPLAVVRSHAELALRPNGHVAPLPDDVVHSLERIAAQAGRMGHVVEDLLLLARLDAGRPLGREPVDLTRLVLDAVDDMRATAQDHVWRLALPASSVWVDGDAHALAQVVSNLLANAAVHTPRGTTVVVTVVRPDAGDDGAPSRARFTVADNGPGMPADVADHAFDRFVRGERPRSADRGSSGLGLPIVAAIVAAQGGVVGLHSDRAGTTVSLTLPASVAGDAGDDGDDVPVAAEELSGGGP